MSNEKPLNKPLIIISAVVVFIYAGILECTEPIYLKGQHAIIGGTVTAAFAPIFALWIKALWNNIILGITSWREITFIETIGLMVVIWLLGA